MKRIILLLIFTSTIFTTMGQSVTIDPSGHIESTSPSPELILTSNGPPEIRTKRSAGTLAVPSAIGSYSSLLQINGQGYTGLGYSGDQARIGFTTSENWTSSARGTHLQFFTTTIGTTLLTERMRISDNGNIGIGTSSPNAKFHINHDGSDSDPHLKINATGLYSRINWTNDANNNKFTAQSSLGSATASANYLRFEYNGSTKLTIAGDGKVTHAGYSQHNGFTRLGTDSAPAIKMKKLTGTTDEDIPGTYVLHGLTFDKIIAVTALIEDGNGIKHLPVSHLNPAESYRMTVTTDEIRLSNINGNLRGEKYVILITYEE